MTEAKLQLLAVYSNPSLRGLRETKQLVARTKQLRRERKMPVPPVELINVNSLTDAIGRALASPKTRIVLACGYSTPEIRETVADLGNESSLRIISQPASEAERYHTPTASFFEQRAITRVRSLPDGVRKAIILYAARDQGTLREIKKASEFTQFFSLRYRVWKAMGYIPAQDDVIGCNWEIDHFDRFSSAVGYFLSDGTLAACARLVHQFGREHLENVKRIKKALERQGCDQANRAFSYPGTAEQPFDILCEFRGFRDYFRAMVHNRSSVAEISRVIVSPEVRGSGLAEVMVDSLVSLAKAQGINVLMLACRTALEPLYRHCGFVPVKNLVSDKFLNIAEQSMVMERKLKPSKS